LERLNGDQNCYREPLGKNAAEQIKPEGASRIQVE